MGSNYGRFMSYASQGNLIGMQQFLESLHPEEASGMVHYEDGTGRTALVLASENGDLPMIKYLVMKKGNLRTKDHAGCTPLMVACQYNYVDLVHYLLQVDLNLLQDEDQQLQTSLHMAVAIGAEDIVLLLLQYGANLLSEDINGKRPLQLAQQMRHTGIVKILLEYGDHIPDDEV
jgi:ankyrin repeat protein